MADKFVARKSLAALGVVLASLLAVPAAGGSTAFGGAPTNGGPSSVLAAPLTAMARQPHGEGFWLLGGDGGVFAYGGAGFYGSDQSTLRSSLAVGIAPSSDGKGYWVAFASGLVVANGDAVPATGVGVFPTAPIVGIAATPVGTGYWLVGADGGVLTYGGAHFYGSMGGTPLAAPIVGMAATPDGGGYWLVAADGGIFSFGDAHFYDSMGGRPLAAPIVGMAASPDGGGYWLVAADGGVFSFGDAPFFGSTQVARTTPVVAMAAAGRGYWLTTSANRLPAASLPGVVAQCNLPASGPSTEPSSILLACGDGNASLTALRWTSWTATTATATGVLHLNQCQPDCAQGTFIDYPATITLGYPLQTGAGLEFGQIGYSYVSSSGQVVAQQLVAATDA